MTDLSDRIQRIEDASRKSLSPEVTFILRHASFLNFGEEQTHFEVLYLKDIFCTMEDEILI